MSDWPLPPLYEPRGPRDTDEEVVRAFLRHQGPSPHSERLHVEDRVLRTKDLLALFLRFSGPNDLKAPVVAGDYRPQVPSLRSPRVDELGPSPHCDRAGILEAIATISVANL